MSYLCERDLNLFVINIVKLMLEITFSGPGKNFSGADKATNR